MSKPRYVVTEQFPGSDPEGEPMVFSCKREATAFAAESARFYRQAGYRVTGSVPHGYSVHPNAWNDLGVGFRIDIHSLL